MSKTFNDKAFMGKTGVNYSTLKLFRAMLRQNNQLTLRQNLSEAHLKLYLKAEQLRKQTGKGWEETFKQVIIDKSLDDTTVDSKNDRLDNVSRLMEELGQLKNTIKELNIHAESLVKNLQKIEGLRD